jgi:ribonuclease T2
MAARILFIGGLVAGAAASLYGESNLNHTCVLSEPLLSCSPPTLAANASQLLDTCCVETFGGKILIQNRVH